MKFCLSLFLTIFLSSYSYGQSRIIEGQILAKLDSIPLSKSTLHIGSGMIGIVADRNGKYKLEIPFINYHDTVYVNHIGFKEYKIPLSDIEDEINFYLLDDTIKLKEVRIINEKSSERFASLKQIRKSRKRNSSIFYPLSIDKAADKAKTEDKLILAYFSAKWCGPSNWMELNVFGDSTVVNILHEKYVAVKLYADKRSSEKPMSTYKITGYPTFLVLDAEKIVRNSKWGRLNKSEFINFLIDNHSSDTSIPTDRERKNLDEITSKVGVTSIGSEMIKINSPGSHVYKKSINPELGIGVGTNLIEGMGFNSSIFVSIEKNRNLIRPSIAFIQTSSANSLQLVSNFGYTFFKPVFFGLPGGMRAMTSFFYGVNGLKNKSFDNNSYGLRYGLESYIGDTSKIALSICYNHNLKDYKLENTQFDSDGIIMMVSFTF